MPSYSPFDVTSRGGVITYAMGAPRGIVNAQAVAASNNEMWGVRFEPTVGNGTWRFNVPNLPGYTGGDVTIRMYWTSAFSGDVNEQAVWDLGYFFPVEGTVLGSFADIRQSVAMETYAFDTFRSTDFILPSANVVAASPALFLRVQRTLGVAGVEFDNGIYVHFLTAYYGGSL
jgi:hypothetical protein